MYMYAWKSGLKTTYYLRSRPATRIAKTTVAVVHELLLMVEPTLAQPSPARLKIRDPAKPASNVHSL